MSGDEPIVAVSPYGRTAASTRVRLRQWFDRTGLAVETHSYLGGVNNRFPTLAKSAHRIIGAERDLRELAGTLGSRTLILSRQASPFSSGAIEESLLSRAAHSVYDFDDALYLDTRRLSRKVWSSNRLWSRAVQAADIVVAGSEVLADAAVALSDNVIMIPSCVEPSSFTPKLNYELGAPPRAVWIGSPATEPFLAMLEEPLLEVHRRRGLRLTVISRGRARLGRLDALVDRVEWSIDSFPAELAKADVGIMPLPNTPFARGKCAYKLLQYAATALPIIGSPVGANDDVIRQFGAFAATTSGDWVDAFLAVIDASAQERQVMGSAALGAVVAEYSYDVWQDRWLDAVRGRPNPTPGLTPQTPSSR